MRFGDYVPASWSPSQRPMILGIVIALFLFGSIRLLLNRSYVSDPQPISPARAQDLADRLDPNTADAATLAVLPSIGEKRAADIVAYRERYLADHPNEIAFAALEDLLRIRGIGVATIDQMKPFLIFPNREHPTSQSAAKP